MSKKSGMTLKSAQSKAATERALKKVSKAENPALGTTLFIIYCGVKTVNSVLTQLLYNRMSSLKIGDYCGEYDLTPFQMLFMRCAMGIVLMIGAVNVNLKRDTWDCVTRDGVGSLIMKTFTGTSTNIINTALPKYLPLTLISVVSNLSPVIVVSLAYCILKERLKKFEWVMLGLTIGGIMVYVYGGSSAADDPDKCLNDTAESAAAQAAADAAAGVDPSATADDGPTYTWWILLLLFINPFLSAGGTIAMRQMKKFSDAIVAWYMNWSVMIASFACMMITGNGFGIYKQFDWVCWILMVANAVTSVFGSTLRFKSLKFQTASALQTLIPVITLF